MKISVRMIKAQQQYDKAKSVIEYHDRFIQELLSDEWSHQL